MAGLVRLKGKTAMEYGRFRGFIDGVAIQWTTTPQIVEVTEETAQEIEADPMVNVVRLGEGDDGAELDVQHARLLQELTGLKAELAELKAAMAAGAAENDALKAELAALKAGESRKK